MKPIWMKPIWMLAAVAGLMAGPAFAQSKIAPSRLYSNQSPSDYTTRPSTLDKNYGLPKTVMPDLELPQRKAPTPEPEADQPAAFKGLSTHARPETQPSDAPNFFAETPGIGSPGTQTGDVPNFFQATPDVPTKSRQARAGYSTMETPLSTTEGMSTGDTTADDVFARDTAGDSTTGSPGGMARP
jgi:hypothetical protein